MLSSRYRTVHSPLIEEGSDAESEQDFIEQEARLRAEDSLSSVGSRPRCEGEESVDAFGDAVAILDQIDFDMIDNDTTTSQKKLAQIRHQHQPSSTSLSFSSSSSASSDLLKSPAVIAQQSTVSKIGSVATSRPSAFTDYQMPNKQRGSGFNLSGLRYPMTNTSNAVNNLSSEPNRRDEVTPPRYSTKYEKEDVPSFSGRQHDSFNNKDARR